MRMYKRHYVGLLAATLICFGALLAFFTYESRTAADDGLSENLFNIRIILKARGNPPDFWRVVEQGIDEAAKEYGVNCEISAPKMEKDVDVQIALMEEAIAKKPDAIILAACDYERLAPVCRKATEQGILLVSLDSDVNFDRRSCFIGTDNHEMGKKLALLVGELIGPDEKFGVIGHIAATATAMERRDGLLGGVHNAQGRLAAIAYCEGSEELARERAVQMIAEHPEIKCLVGLNESSALGAATAIRELGKEGEIKMIACDSSEKQVQFMESGTIQAFVIQNPFSMGYLSVLNTVKLLQGESVPEEVHTDSVIIKKEDLYKNENQKLMFPFINAE